jgi:hypothetical protein
LAAKTKASVLLNKALVFKPNWSAKDINLVEDADNKESKFLENSIEFLS